MTYETKDSGTRAEFASGMVRDTDADKVQYHRIAEGPMLRRWAELLTRGAAKYPDRPDRSANWTLAAGDEEYQRFRASAFRHFMQFMNGETDEDHAAAVFFNINGMAYVREQQEQAAAPEAFTTDTPPAFVPAGVNRDGERMLQPARYRRVDKLSDSDHIDAIRDMYC